MPGLQDFYRGPQGKNNSVWLTSSLLTLSHTSHIYYPRAWGMDIIRVLQMRFCWNFCQSLHNNHALPLVLQCR